MYKKTLLSNSSVALLTQGTLQSDRKLEHSTILSRDTVHYCIDNDVKKKEKKSNCYILPRSYSYYIEVSMDELDWVRVVDHSKFLCRSWQNLYFQARVCRLMLLHTATLWTSCATAWLIVHSFFFQKKKKTTQIG